LKRPSVAGFQAPGDIRRDNCFTWIKDFAAAQRLLDAQLETDWPALLQRWITQSNPVEPAFLGKPVPYYWTVQEGEYATDIVFRTEEDLRGQYPLWVHQGYATLQCRDLMRFLEYRVGATGTPRSASKVKSTIKELVEGTCLRHRIQGNLLKMYDKMGSILRVETMLHDLTHFRVFRTTEGEQQGRQRYMRLRKGVADLHRRAEISQRINERYVEALATVEEKKSLEEVTQALGRRTSWHGRTRRALNPLTGGDSALLAAVNRAEFMVQGFRNRDLRALLFAEQAAGDAAEEKRRSTQVTRRLQLLRAHGLIAKVPKTQRYQVTAVGRTAITALLAARQANVKQLLQAA
jgi:hypothetical protein